MTISSGVQIWNYLTTRKSRKMFGVSWTLHYICYTEVLYNNRSQIIFPLVSTLCGLLMEIVCCLSSHHQLHIALSNGHAISWLFILAYSINFRYFWGFLYLLLQKIVKSFSRGFFLIIHKCLKNELSFFVRWSTAPLLTFPALLSAY